MTLDSKDKPLGQTAVRRSCCLTGNFDEIFGRLPVYFADCRVLVVTSILRGRLRIDWILAAIRIFS